MEAAMIVLTVAGVAVGGMVIGLLVDAVMKQQKGYLLTDEPVGEDGRRAAGITVIHYED